MAIFAEHRGVLKLAATDGATSVTAYSDNVINATLKIKRNTGTHHTLSNQWGKTVHGGSTFEIEVEGEAGTALHTLFLDWIDDDDGSRLFEFYAPDETTGSNKWSGSVTFNGLDPASAHKGGSGDVSKFKTTLMGNGAITYAVVGP